MLSVVILPRRWGLRKEADDGDRRK
jgi:hypothetical protein